MDFTFTKIEASPEVTCRVWMQLSDFKDAIQLPEDRKQALFLWAIDITRKLESVKYHRDNLLRVLAENFEKLSDQPQSSNASVVEINTGAEKEFEAFLLQGKSTLDVLVKMFVPLFEIKLHSYGDAGAKVAKALQRNLNATQLKRARPLFGLIEAEQEWIERWFCSHRDTVAHYKPIGSTGFIRPPIENEVPRQAPPATSDGIAFHEVVTVLYQNLLTFVEDFIAVSAHITFPPQFTVGVIPLERRDKEWPRKYGMFLAKTPPVGNGARPVELEE